MPTASKRLRMVLVDSSIAMMPLPGATIARATLSRSSMLIGDSAMVGTMPGHRSEEHTSGLQSLMRISYAVFCLKKKRKMKHTMQIRQIKQDPTHKANAN